MEKIVQKWLRLLVQVSSFLIKEWKTQQWLQADSQKGNQKPFQKVLENYCFWKYPIGMCIVSFKFQSSENWSVIFQGSISL